MIGGLLSSSCADDRYKYPAVVVDRVSVSVLGKKREDKYLPYPYALPAIVDTGASQSAIPLAVCRGLHIRSPHGLQRVQSLDRQSPAPQRPCYYVKLGLDGIGEAKLLATAAARSSVILGRDFLAELALTLVMDSASRKWSMGRLGPQGILGRWAAKLLKLD